MNKNITEDSTRHCRRDQVANGTYSLPLIMTEKKEIFIKISALQHTFSLQKNTCTKPKNLNQNTIFFFLMNGVF